MGESTEITESFYQLHPVYQGIRDRFWLRYQIKIGDYIGKVTDIKWRLEEGFDFVPTDFEAFTSALRKAGFVHDVRDKHLGIIPSVGYFAALATEGEGYREPGSPSLHCAVARRLCKVHLDNFGFVLNGGYGPDAGEHIIDELGYQTYVVANVAKLSVPVASVLARFHPVLPNSRQFKPFSAAGFQFDLLSGRSRDLQRQWKLTIDVTHACSDLTCGALRFVHGQEVRGENQFMLRLYVLGG